MPLRLLLSLWMGKHHILQTDSQAYDSIVYLKSPMKSDNNCIIKVVYFAQIAESLFFRLDQPVRMRSPQVLNNADCF